MIEAKQAKFGVGKGYIQIGNITPASIVLVQFIGFPFKPGQFPNQRLTCNTRTSLSRVAPNAVKLRDKRLKIGYVGWVARQ